MKEVVFLANLESLMKEGGGDWRDRNCVKLLACDEM